MKLPGGVEDSPLEHDEHSAPYPCGIQPVLPDGKCVRHTSFPEDTWFRARRKSGSRLEGYARRNRVQADLWNFIPDEDEEVIMVASSDLEFLEAIR